MATRHVSVYAGPPTRSSGRRTFGHNLCSRPLSIDDGPSAAHHIAEHQRRDVRSKLCVEERLGVMLVLELPALDEIDERLPGVANEHSEDSEHGDDSKDNNSLNRARSASRSSRCREDQGITHDEGISLTIAVDQRSRNSCSRHGVREGFGRSQRKSRSKRGCAGQKVRERHKKGSKQRTVPDRLAKIAENRKEGRPAPVVETKV